MCKIYNKQLEVAANCSENYTELINTLCGQFAEIVYVETGGWCKNHRT